MNEGFRLPNGKERSPDLAWVARERLEDLTVEQTDRFLPLCPDFVVEIRSPSDDVAPLQEKMQEYIDNGAKLGWLPAILSNRQWPLGLQSSLRRDRHDRRSPV